MTAIRGWAPCEHSGGGANTGTTPIPAVLKFGGTSVASAGRLRRVGAIVREASGDSPIVVVVSAMAGVTDALLQIAEAAARGGTRWRPRFSALERRHLDTMSCLSDPREWLDQWWTLRTRLSELHRLLAEVADTRRCDAPGRARIVATGERLSATLSAAALRAAGCRTAVVDATELIVTDSAFDEATVDAAATRQRVRRRLLRLLPGTIPVVTGFIAADRWGRVTLLGRGGSDYSAAVLGAALGAHRVEIWTDVPGVLSAPPRWVPEAVTIPRLAPGEATALARWGGKVLHPRTLEPLALLRIPVVVASTLDPGAPATLVAGKAPSPRPLAVTGRTGVALSPGCSGVAALDPLDGEPCGRLIEEGQGSIVSTARTGLAVAAVVGGGGRWTTSMARLLRELRLPILAVVPELDGGALGLVVRAHHLRRTVKVLHDALVAHGLTAAVAGRVARVAVTP